MKEFISNLLWAILGLGIIVGGSYLICFVFVGMALMWFPVAVPYIQPVSFVVFTVVWFVKAILWFMKFDWLFGKKGKTGRE